MLRNIYIFLGSALIFMLSACTDRLSDSPQNDGKKGFLVATIAGTRSAETRARISSDDFWSYTRFDDPKDKVGFYSLGGNLDGENSNGPFVNAPMVYIEGEAGSRDEDWNWRSYFNFEKNVNYDADRIDPSKTFVYYPYTDTDEMEDAGMELRRTAEDGSYRCVDALVASIKMSEGGSMSGTFSHTFAEIVILRGYGFDAPPEGKEAIKVVTTLPYSHAKVVDNTNTGHDEWKILKPVYDPDNTTLSEQQCREWVAWNGAPYVENGKEIPAQYVIIPTAISSDRSTVNYVELYDNTGTLHKVTTFGLMNETDKRISPNERYWLTVQLEGLVPTIFPFAITPWAEETRYTEQRARGINTAEEFMQFVLSYNAYNGSGRSASEEEQLKQFGDRYEKDGDVRWHFHINHDIDLSGLTVDKLNISTLCDTLDGRTNTLYGIKSDKAFITELQSKGCIRNLDITGLNIHTTEDNVTGGLINQMTGGLITGCNVDGYLNVSGAAGLAVGQFDAGTISSSSFSGVVVGISSYEDKGLIGQGPSQGLSPEMLKGVNTSGLIFTKAN